jgi:hemoglobin
MLLDEPGYDGFVLAAHAHVHDTEAFRLEHFYRWYALWVATIDDRWAGRRAELAKQRAWRIGQTLARRLLGTAWTPNAARP